MSQADLCYFGFSTEYGVFGVPLSILVERDRDLKPDSEVPIFLSKLIGYIEENGLKEEGVLRVPGSTTRIKELQGEVEKQFYNGTFKFQNLRVNDAVGLLKLFLRELPSPPLTLEYVNAFSSVEQINDRKKQLQCLNLLILVLPDVYRATLKVMTIFNKKGKEKRRSMLEDVLEGIIRIQTPGDEEKVFTTVQLSEHTTADDIVAKFTQDLNPIATPILRRPHGRSVRRSREAKH
ncbi:putative rho GTPase-activating protein 18 isoform X3 [Apostichopus japonicus]|uniref:Putative rho GTPase-activating protein 18 isoform X3 n=1 Tax=Stichopus japonicus TaxID=307972 RepID=A0A2G8K0T3_STIJA|nr:putative rho GTPase-activating protein 18 isoform X3 [Apostichopus japonicus]